MRRQRGLDRRARRRRETVPVLAQVIHRVSAVGHVTRRLRRAKIAAVPVHNARVVPGIMDCQVVVACGIARAPYLDVINAGATDSLLDNADLSIDDARIR